MTIRLQTLGHLAVFVDGVEHSRLRSQQIPLALLTYLAVERRATREELTTLLWPRRSPDAASHALSQTVYRLRQELGDAWIDSHPGGLDVTAGVEVDVHEFDSTIDRMRWRRALDLYSGPFLAGIYLVDSNAFEVWVDLTRSRLEEAYAQANLRFIDERLEARDLDGAVSAARRWVSLDPLGEQGQRTLIELLARAGHRSKALRQYEKYERLLAAELEVEPLPETRDLVRRLRAGEIGPPTPRPGGEPGGLDASGDRPSAEAEEGTPSAGPVVSTGHEPETGPSRGRRPHRIAWGALIVAGLAALIGTLLILDSGAPPATSRDTRIAVLPFGPTVPDSALARLGRDLVVTVSTNLDGLSEVMAIDPSAILAHTVGGEVRTADEARALAEMLGATRFVYGSLIRSGDRIRLDLGLFHTGASDEVRRTSTEAPLGDLMAMTDSTTWAIVRQLWRGEEAPVPSFSAVTTQSIPALETFIEAEHALVEGRWMPAARAFRRAHEIDPTFWLAYWRHAWVARWIGMPVDSSVVDTYRVHRYELPEREQLLVELEFAEALGERLRIGRRVTDQFPDFWPGWLEHGDDLIHFGPFLGYELADARPHFERAVALNMTLIPAWQHLIHFHVQDYDSAAVATVIDTLDRLGAWESLAEGYGFDQRIWITLLDQLKRRGEADPDLVDSFVRTVKTMASLYGADKSLGHLLLHDLPAQEIDVMRRLRATGSVSADLLAEAYRVEALSWIARGAWDSALVASDEFARRVSTLSGALFAYRVAAIGAWVGAQDLRSAQDRRRAVVSRRNGTEPWMEAELAWVDGLLAFAGGDGAALRAAMEAVRAAGSEESPALVAGLRAFRMRLDGDEAAAGQALADLEWERAERVLDRYSAHPFLTAVHRLAAARWLRRTGSFAQAERLLRFYEALSGGEADLYTANAALASLAVAERALVATEVGDTSRAIGYWRQFLHRYDRPPPAHQSLLETARSALRMERVPR